MTTEPNRMQKIVSLCKRRGFVYPGSEIYGGLANSWDFGPYGAQMKKNIKDLWWKRFVVSRKDMVGIDTALLMNPKVWHASGHVAGFTDPLVECKKCHSRFRFDHIQSEIREEGAPSCKEGGMHDFTAPKQFNLMFQTHIGPVLDEASLVYFRPETAQGMFVNFKNILDSARVKIPFGIAQIGKAYRNEITPGNFIFRVLEFEQMEIEYFIHESEWEKWFATWQKDMEDWLSCIGITKEHWTIREHNKDELSHYSKRTVDIEYHFPFGIKELYGLAYRTNFDLTNHAKHSGVDLAYTDPDSGERFFPHVIEPTFGVERTALALLCDAYKEEKERVVLKLDPKIAPVKIAVFPLLRNKPALVEKAHEIFETLRTKFACEFDDNGNVGKRYRRQDEIGTPYCVTVDFDTLDNTTVTVRDRDTMVQERISVRELEEYFGEKNL